MFLQHENLINVYLPKFKEMLFLQFAKNAFLYLAFPFWVLNFRVATGVMRFIA